MVKVTSLGDFQWLWSCWDVQLPHNMQDHHGVLSAAGWVTSTGYTSPRRAAPVNWFEAFPESVKVLRCWENVDGQNFRGSQQSLNITLWVHSSYFIKHEQPLLVNSCDTLIATVVYQWFVMNDCGWYPLIAVYSIWGRPERPCGLLLRWAFGQDWCLKFPTHLSSSSFRQHFTMYAGVPFQSLQLPKWIPAGAWRYQH